VTAWPCLDFHTHVFPDRVAEQAVAALWEAYRAEPRGPATVAGLRAALDEAQVQQAVLCPVATRPEQVGSINRWVVAQDPERFIPFGALHPESEHTEDELAFLRDQGVRGVKLQPHFQGFALESPALLRLFERLEGFVVLLHGGQEIRPIDFVPTTPERVRALHERFPQQRLVIAHLGGYHMWQEVRDCLVGLPLHLDLSYTFGRLADETIAQIIAAHGPERIVFGSDYPWMLPAETRAGLARLELPEAQEREILAENAWRLLGR
jgi:hypothetical protein